MLVCYEWETTTVSSGCVDGRFVDVLPQLATMTRSWHSLGCLLIKVRILTSTDSTRQVFPPAPHFVQHFTVANFNIRGSESCLRLSIHISSQIASYVYPDRPRDIPGSDQAALGPLNHTEVTHKPHMGFDEIVFEHLTSRSGCAAFMRRQPHCDELRVERWGWESRGEFSRAWKCFRSR